MDYGKKEIRDEALAGVAGGIDDRVDSRVIAILSEQLSIPAVGVKGSIIDDLGADSMDIVDIVSNIEDEFRIQIPEDEFGYLKTVDDIVDIVNTLIRR